jgi:peptide chain release factor 1
MSLLAKLEHIDTRYHEVGELLMAPDVMSDMKRFTQLNKEYRNLQDIVEVYHTYKNLLSNIDTNKKIIAVCISRCI